MLKSEDYVFTMRRPVKTMEPYKSDPKKLKKAMVEWNKLVDNAKKRFIPKASPLLLVGDIDIVDGIDKFTLTLQGRFEEPGYVDSGSMRSRVSKASTADS